MLGILPHKLRGMGTVPIKWVEISSRDYILCKFAGIEYICTCPYCGEKVGESGEKLREGIWGKIFVWGYSHPLATTSLHPTHPLAYILLCQELCHSNGTQYALATTMPVYEANRGSYVSIYPPHRPLRNPEVLPPHTTRPIYRNRSKVPSVQCLPIDGRILGNGLVLLNLAAIDVLVTCLIRNYVDIQGID